MIIFWFMSDDGEILVDLLRDVLGDEHLHYESKGQISFDCPECDDDRHKGNLEINYFSHVYKCWSCGDVNGTHGPLGKLFDKYGNKSQKKVYKVLQPEEYKPKEVRKEKLRLPNEIVPSYSESGELNYFIARSWIPNTKAKYKNPEAEKDKIIFNESLINWNQDIFLVEGVFDGFFLPNSIAMLGKHMSEKLFDTIYQRAMGNVIIALDGDAWYNAVKLYHELNGGGLYGKIKILKLPEDKDVCDLRGEINDYYYNIKD